MNRARRTLLVFVNVRKFVVKYYKLENKFRWVIDIVQFKLRDDNGPDKICFHHVIVKSKMISEIDQGYVSLGYCSPSSSEGG
jgi:hypothetical protein